MTKRYVNSTLSCFCEIRFSQMSYYLLFEEFREDGRDRGPEEYERYVAELEKKGLEDEVDSANICNQFIIYSKFSQNYFWMASFVIFLFNLFLYEMTAPILSITGFRRRTEQ